MNVAQFVIVDMGIPNQSHISATILTSVSNILCLSKAGNIPVVGLAIINTSYQPIIRLTSTQSTSKLKKILDVISSVKNMVKCRARISTDEFQDYVQLGLKLAIEDFDSYPRNHLVDGEVYPEKLQITIFSMKNLSGLFNHLQKTLQNLDTRRLFKIQVIEIAEDFSNLSPPKKVQSCTFFFEYMHIKGTVKILDKLMKQWLTCGDVFHHIQLVLPDIIIWCDARNCIVRHSSSQACQENVEETVEDEDVLQVMYRASADGICDAQIFGDPVLLMPCQWQNHLKTGEYGRLISNTQCLLDLSSKLEADNKYLIAKYEKTNQPTRFMVLMPGEGVLLAKELVSAEMDVPVSGIPMGLGNAIHPVIGASVTSALVCLPSVSSYDPSNFSSGLYNHLLRKIRQPTTMESLNQESSNSDLVQKSVAVKIEMKRKVKLKRVGSRTRDVMRNISELPALTESNQQTLATCTSKQGFKLF